MIFIIQVILENIKAHFLLKKILNDICNGDLFGCIEVDIEVKDDAKHKYNEYPPFFVTCEVSKDLIREHMTDYCNKNDINFKTKKLLLSGLKAGKILLATPLLNWYLNHDCNVTRIYQIIEFTPNRCFEGFIDKVTKYRVLGDKHPDMSILGACYKLISNSSYGSLLMDKSKHTNIKYLSDIGSVSSIINSPNFKDIEEFENNLYEVETFKSLINIDNPIQIWFFILEYAKLRMLQFYFDCLIKYLKPKSFELIETETDNLYMALNQENLEMCINLN